MKNELPNLTSRLEKVKSFVREGRIVADVGTDHAYLPVFLVNSGICPRAVASDVREGPLERARLTAKKYNALDKIEFFMADGLCGIDGDEIDDVVIAGMGGELIATIISKCGWLKMPEKHLVLQPMTAQKELRAFLLKNGFKIDKEAVALEKKGQKCYLVMSVYYDGTAVKTAADDFYCLTGLLQNGGVNERVYLERLSASLKRKADGLRKGKNKNGGNIDEAEKALRLADRIDEMCKNMKIDSEGGQNDISI